MSITTEGLMPDMFPQGFNKHTDALPSTNAKIRLRVNIHKSCDYFGCF